jgi:thioredoxin 1
VAEPITISDDQFENQVLNSDKPVLVDFWAEWCGPCHMIAPHVAAIADEEGEHLKVAKLDIDNNPITPGRYRVMSIPTLMLFKNGEAVERIIGAMPKERILAKVKPHLEPEAA